MRAAGRPGRGERARVAERVRELLGDDPAARIRADPEPGWRPGDEFDEHVPLGRPSVGSDRLRRIRVRWDPGRRGAAALGLTLVAVVAATGWWLAASRPHSEPVATESSLPAGSAMATSTTSPTGGAATGATGTGSLVAPAPGPSSATAPAAPTAPDSPGSSAVRIVVDVAGRVRHPGIYTLPSDARVYDAVRAAGGVRRGASTISINLAAPLQDGEQILVGVPGGSSPTSAVPSAGGSVSAGGEASSGAPVDLNTATLEQLEALPGVGPVLAQNIVDYRTANGPFTSVDQLDDVTGIGDVRLAQLRPLVSL